MGDNQQSGYRVELRVGDQIEELGALDASAYPHFTSLTPFVSRLRLEGRANGEVVLVDRVTGRVVARHRLTGRSGLARGSDLGGECTPRR
jgi:hypothetical protein